MKAVLHNVSETICTTFGILFGGKMFIKSIPSYEEIIVMDWWKDWALTRALSFFFAEKTISIMRN